MNKKNYRLPTNEEINTMTLVEYMERLGLSDPLFFSLLLQPENLDQVQQDELKRLNNKKLSELSTSTRGSVVIALLEIKRMKMQTDNLQSGEQIGSGSSWRISSTSKMSRLTVQRPITLQHINFEEISDHQTLEEILGNQWQKVYDDFRSIGEASASLMKKNQKKTWKEVGTHFQGMLKRTIRKRINKERRNKAS